ncbi:MAG: hypothetical protein RLZZ502_1446, partial [Pseudomonadota bacterium]
RIIRNANGAEVCYRLGAVALNNIVDKRNYPQNWRVSFPSTYCGRSYVAFVTTAYYPYTFVGAAASQTAYYPQILSRHLDTATASCTTSNTAKGSNPAGNSTLSYTFYNASINGGHYFITSNQAEANALIAGADGGRWQVTRRGFRSWPTPYGSASQDALSKAAGETSKAAPAGTVALHRFYIRSFGGSNINSHFYTVDNGEANALKAQNPSNSPDLGWKYEGIDSYVMPKNAAGNCPAEYQKVYRAYNQRNFVDPNHRFSTSFAEQYRLIKLLGYKDEGVAFCSPYSTDALTDVEAYHTVTNQSLKAGDSISATFLFSNAGPGSAHGSIGKINLPSNVSWTTTCTASEGASCPSGVSNDMWRAGVMFSSLPPGGVVSINAVATAPAVAGSTALNLSISNSIKAPASVGDLTLSNNSTSVTEVTVHAASGCTYALTVDTIQIDAAGGSAFTRMKAPASCGWTASSPASWVSAVTPSATGSAAINFTVAPNPASTARTTTITANGQTLTINQAGNTALANCVIDVEPRSVMLEYNDMNDLHSFISTSGACPVVPKPNIPWISIAKIEAVTGGLLLTYGIDRNLSNAPRSAVVKIGSQEMDVVQKSAADAATTGNEGGVAGAGGEGSPGTGGESSGGTGEGPGGIPNSEDPEL